MNYTLGIDFGTESARAVIVEVPTGDIVGTASANYTHGVIDKRLSPTDPPLPPEFALQDPDDWRTAMESCVRAALASSKVNPRNIIGIGIDFTSCTILPVKRDGTPLCELRPLRSKPHAWPKLWKHHAAQPQADRINALAVQRNEEWLPRYGGKISAEWVLPKALQMAEDDTQCYAAADFLVEGGDWIVWQLTGVLVRNACAAGYKGTWHKTTGWPSPQFLGALHREMGNLFTSKFSGPIMAAGGRVGGLTRAWADRLGLRGGTPVGAAIIDAHAACIGGGVASAGTMFIMTGTSSCHMLMGEKESLAPGISGVVEDGIVYGLFGYEAGQASAGDTIKWFAENATPPAYNAEAARRGITIYEVLAERAAKLAPGASGLLALDWWNGCRTPLVDSDLSGLILGLNLATRPEEIYRALIEATAFGTRAIIEAFTAHDITVNAVVVGGGLTRSDLTMQIYADVTGRPITVSGGSYASGIGAAVLGAVAAGAVDGGYDKVVDAAAKMSAKTDKVFVPNELHVARYSDLYVEYSSLMDHFGKHGTDVMRRLRTMRRDATNS